MQKIEYHAALVRKFNRLKAKYSAILRQIDGLSGNVSDDLQAERIAVWNEMVRVKDKADEINTRAK
ncbi:hypothetical protein [Psychrobacter sp. K31L]|uniref:hypothetical protein n=1 Tax=Psychrobacter sp. K31L TaxID=2820758 RepID=UPI001B34444F|nr:hypothetical protein [Psychrobacter sp. K31L]MBP3945150.1 hypothetical protein [Psychrobacter sp. K31L]